MSSDNSTNSTNSISSVPELSQAELDKLVLTPEAKTHYSQENEIKRLIIERETYKKAYELQQENINEVVNKLDNIMSQQEYFNHQYETSLSKMNFSKMPRFKIEDDIEYIKNFIFY